MYAITATVSHYDGQYRGLRQIPTFYLNENVQGIKNEDHARVIAIDILDPFNTGCIAGLTVVKL